MLIPYEPLNLWLPEQFPLYEKVKTLTYHQATVDAYEKERTFLRQGLSKKEFDTVPELLGLMEKYRMIPKVFMLEPNTTYDWHGDAYRYIAINCLLTHDDEDYLTLFCMDIENYHHVYFNTKRLVYEPRRFYMFNTLVPHMVTNFSDKPRYLLTIAPYTAGKIPDNMDPKKADFSHFLKMRQEFQDMGLIN
jgi:hypothetical protein